MIVKAYLLNVFGVDESGGNPAGVVLDADTLADEQRKQLQKKSVFLKRHLSINLQKQISI